MFAFASDIRFLVLIGVDSGGHGLGGHGLGEHKATEDRRRSQEITAGCSSCEGCPSRRHTARLRAQM